MTDTAPDVLLRDDARLRLTEVGQGAPILFQHGLGGDATQVADHAADGEGWHRLTVECRGHGASSPGSVRPFSLAMFADDCLAASTARFGARAFVAAGISMGAAVALHLAGRRPERVRALILIRPAWLFDPAPEGLAPLAEVGALLRSLPPETARRRFLDGPTARRLAIEGPDNLASLMRFFDRPDPQVMADLLVDITRDGTGIDRSAAARIRCPALVIGQTIDTVHPIELAKMLAGTLPAARFVEVTPKALDKRRHAADVRAATKDFLAGLR